MVLRQKGVVLDSLLEDRLVAEASEDPKQREAVEQLRGAKQRLTQLQLETQKIFPRKPRNARPKKKNSPRKSKNWRRACPASRGLGNARRALSVTVEQVQGLAEQEALIELVRYA